MPLRAIGRARPCGEVAKRTRHEQRVEVVKGDQERERESSDEAIKCVGYGEGNMNRRVGAELLSPHCGIDASINDI
jgi:hypothetical protein